PWADRAGDLQRRGALRHFLVASIGKRDLDHLGHKRVLAQQASGLEYLSLAKLSTKGQTRWGIGYSNAQNCPFCRVGAERNPGCAEWGSIVNGDFSPTMSKLTVSE